MGSTQTTPTTGGTSYGFTYTYDLAGDMLSEKYPSGKVINIEYDKAGRINQVSRTSGPTYASSIAYTAPGAMQSMTLGNGLIDQTTYNSRLEPTKIQLGSSSTGAAASSVSELDYSFNTSGQTDNNGNLLEQTIKIGNTTIADQTYSYDQVNRIASATETTSPTPGSPVTWSRTFGYDVYGNMWVPAGWMGIMPGNQTPQSSSAFNASNQLTIGSSAYDGAGNLKVDPDGNLITYDAENRMTQFTAHSGNTVANYSYDGDGKRISKSVTQAGVAGGAAVTTTYVYNAMGQLIAEYGGPTPTTTGTSYLTTDHLGSTRVITDSTSPTPDVLERDDYLPFGEEIGNIGSGRSGQGVVGYSSSTDIHQKFTSKERDSESQLDFFDARYFSSAQGRFTSPDEFTGGPEDLFDFGEAVSGNPTFYADIAEPQSLNKYQYCYNNPLSFVDPNGHQIKEATKAAAQVLSDVVVGETKELVNTSIETGLGPKIINEFSTALTGKPLIKPFQPSNGTEKAAGTGASIAIMLIPGVGEEEAGDRLIEEEIEESVDKNGEKAIEGSDTGKGNIPKSRTGKGSVAKDQRDPKRLFTKGERRVKLEEQGGKCADCGKEATVDETNGHHRVRHADGGQTVSSNHVEVCKGCHKAIHRPQ